MNFDINFLFENAILFINMLMFLNKQTLEETQYAIHFIYILNLHLQNENCTRTPDPDLEKKGGPRVPKLEVWSATYSNYINHKLVNTQGVRAHLNPPSPFA